MDWTDSPHQLKQAIARYTRLKEALVAHALSIFGERIVQRSGELISSESPAPYAHSTALAQATEELFAEPWQAHRIIRSFVHQATELSDGDRAMVEGWVDRVTGVFVSTERRGRVIRARNLVDELGYTIVLTGGGTAELRMFDRGSSCMATIVPLLDHWTFTGAQQLLSAKEPRFARGVAARVAQASPRDFFRNPAHLEEGWRQQREEHAAFLERFGRPWVLGSAAEVEEQYRQLKGEASRFVEEVDRVERERLVAQGKAHLADFELPENLRHAASVGMLSDPRDGIFFSAEFGAFLESFQDPDRGVAGRHRKLVLGFLRDDGILPSVFQIVAGKYPDGASELFARLLRRPGFTWVRDGEALMRQYKAAYFKEHPLPSIIPLNDELAEGLVWFETQGGADAQDDSPPLATNRADSRQRGKGRGKRPRRRTGRKKKRRR